MYIIYWTQIKNKTLFFKCHQNYKKVIRNDGRVVQQRRITQGRLACSVYKSCDGESVAAWAELRSWLEGWDQLTLRYPRRGCGSSSDLAAAESEASEWAPWSRPAWFSSVAGETNPINSLGDESLEAVSGGTTIKHKIFNYCISCRLKSQFSYMRVTKVPM